MLAIYVQLIQLHINPFLRTFAFQKFAANEFDKPAPLYTELGGKICDVQFTRFTICFVEDIFLADTKGCRITGFR
jgi:hypothetical protein